MEHCDGYTHSEMTDAYDSYSYPCPGPERCPNSRRPPKTIPAPAPPSWGPHTPAPPKGPHDGPWDQLPKGAA